MCLWWNIYTELILSIFLYEDFGICLWFLKKILSVSSFDIRNKYFISIYFSYQSLEQMDYELFFFFFYTVHSKATGKPEIFFQYHCNIINMTYWPLKKLTQKWPFLLFSRFIFEILIIASTNISILKVFKKVFQTKPHQIVECRLSLRPSSALPRPQGDIPCRALYCTLCLKKILFTSLSNIHICL